MYRGSILEQKKCLFDDCPNSKTNHTTKHVAYIPHANLDKLET